MEVGIDRNVPQMIKNAQNSLNELTALNVPTLSAASTSAGGGAYRNQSITINVSGAPGQNTDAIANAVLKKLQNQIERKNTAYGYIY